MRYLLAPISTLSLVLAAACAAAEKPNIIIILTDDAGYADFSCYNPNGFQTPNIDSIAGNGVRFTDGYVSSSVCSPSRAGLLTGRYQQRFGFHRSISHTPVGATPMSRLGLPVGEITLANVLKEAGYQTHAIGKWHLGEADHFHPNNRGFDDFLGFLRGARSYFLDRKVPENAEILRNRTPLPAADGYTTELFTEEAIRIIRDDDPRPFFIYLAYNAVHRPMDAKPDDLALIEKSYPDPDRKKLAAMTDNLDRQIGRLLKALRESNQFDNTIVYFLNDNGGARNNASSNAPLRGFKGSEWEGGNRVAYLLQWPDQLPGGAVYSQPVIALDVFPTSVAAAGAELPSGRDYDGIDLMPFLRGRAGAPHEYLFWTRGKNDAVRKGRWKLVTGASGTVLYDLSTDIGESKDLSSKHPQLTSELLGALGAWKKTHMDPLWETQYSDRE